MNVTKLPNLLAIIASALLLISSSVIFAASTNKMSTNIEKTIPSNNHAKSNMLFALSAESGSFNNDTLTLNGVKVVIYFTEAPNRTAGQISLAKFNDIWNKRLVPDKTKVPNAVLSLFNKEENTNVVVELLSQSFKGNTLTYTVKLLKGMPDKSFRNATLFIDAFPCAVNGC